MFSDAEFALMKPTAYLVNAARGGIYDVEALARAAEEGRIAGAAIDVYEQEPCTASPLHGHDNIILTPHLGANTKEAQDRAGDQIAEYVMDALEGRPVATALNMAQVPAEVMEAVNPYVAACETAGRVLVQLAPEPITGVEVTVCGELSGIDCNVLGTAVLQGIFVETGEERVNMVNAGHIAYLRGLALTLDSDERGHGFASLVKLVGHAGADEVEVAVTVGSKGETRIVNFLGYKFDVEPAENILIMQYVDGPGRLGKICPILGDADINISTMQVSDQGPEGQVATVEFNLDQPCSDEVRAKLAAALDEYDLKGTWFISLHGERESGQ